MQKEQEIAKELGRTKKQATRVTEDGCGNIMLIEINQGLYHTLMELLIRDDAIKNIKRFTKEQRGFGNHYHNFCIEHIITLENSLTVHLTNPLNNHYLTKRISPFTRIVIPPRIAHAIYGRTGTERREQTDFYDPSDIYPFPIIDLKTGKRIV